MQSAARSIALTVSALFMACVVVAASAQTNYPAKPVRVIIPFPAGASSDVVGRMLAQKMSELLGEQMIADNRAGAGGNLGIAMTAKAVPDGYTILIATGSIAVSPAIYANLGYDPIKDLAPVARLTNSPNILLVHPSVPAKTLREFINLARNAPGKLNFGSGGAGTTNHLANEMLKHLEKINIVHVPYKGVTQAMTAMMGGEVDEVVMPVTTAIPQVRAGKVRALAVLTEQRVPTLPNVPTAKEAGVAGFTSSVWYGMFAPARTSRDIVMRLNQTVVRVLEMPDVRARLTDQGVDPWPGSPEQLAELLRADIERYGVIARSAGLAKQ